jgi:hypothetical protein
MAHFAQLDESNIVIKVIVVNNNELISNGIESEARGADFCQTLLGGKWIQTSYNGNIRKKFAGIGDTYDATRNAFIAPKPFNSWILDEATCQWQTPTPMPVVEGKSYYWSEDDLSWREITNE